MAVRKKRNREPIPVERPMLTDVIRVFGEMMSRPMNMREWQESFFAVAQKPNAPNCLRALVWDMKGSFPRSQDLEDMICFIQALDENPNRFV